MRRYLQSFGMIAAALMVAVSITGSQLNAQQASAAPSQNAQSQEPQPENVQQPNQQYPGQHPGEQTPRTSPLGQPSVPSAEQGQIRQTGPTQGVETFTGMIVKSGPKYVLQDESTGTSYDIDHQDEISKHVGKRVRVNGTLDPLGKTISIQPATR